MPLSFLKPAYKKVGRQSLFTLTLLSLSLTVTMSGCKGRVDPSGMTLTRVEKGESAAQAPTAEQMDLGMEEQVSNGCVAAWRKAIAGDEKTAMADLKELQSRYPKVQTIEMMMGQVAEHFGKNEEALDHFRKAAVGNEFSSMRKLRLAHSLKENGKYQEAIGYYQKLLTHKENMDPILLLDLERSLAQCLLATDKNSGEGKQLLSECLKIKSDDARTLELQKKYGLK